MEKKELSWGRVFILIGALMAFLIGSGFASGQETVQYFTSTSPATELSAASSSVPLTS